MDPITMGTIGLASSVVGGGLGAFGALTKGGSEAAMYKYQAGIADINRQISLQNANYERSLGEVKAQQQGMKGRFETGTIRAQQAGSGLDINRGTTAKVAEGQEAITRYDESLVRSDALRKAYGYETEATKYEAQGKIDRYAAQGSETGGYLSALGSVIGSAGSVSDKWLTGKRIGIWGS